MTSSSTATQTYQLSTIDPEIVWPRRADVPVPRDGERPFRFCYLGPMEHWVDGVRLEVRGTVLGTLLAALLAAQSRPVSVDALVEELWGEQPPAHAENALQANVSRLRRKLRMTGVSADLSGYRLRVADDQVDATVFLRMLDEERGGRDLPPAKAVSKLRAALALWRGPVFGGPVGGPLCQATAVRYESARSFAHELLFDHELRCGRHAEVIPELCALVESDSLNERLCEQLMVALYRTGRQTEALATFHRMRTRLDVELGVAPSPTLRNYERAILAHDPALRVGNDHVAVRGAR